MSAPEEVVIARPINVVASEVRVIRALYPQDCLNHSIQASIIESRKPPCTYQNTGVQTLPPPNGEIYKVIHGREPSMTDYVRNMGAAAIGRYMEDPRSNPYDFMYGTAYPAPPVVQRGTCTDSGFQTASCDTTRTALARAKAKASMTATKYREAANRAGYMISAESKDEMIIHSEQHPPTVQLDAEGNLLEGTIEGRYLPNIYGTPSQPLPSASWKTAISDPRQVSSFTLGESQVALTEPAPHPPPLPSPTIIPQIVQSGLPTPLERISALIPSLTEQAPNPRAIFDNEHSSINSGIDEFVVYDAGATSKPLAPAIVETSVMSSKKRKLGKQHHADPPSRRSKVRKTTAVPALSTDSLTHSPYHNGNAPHRFPSSGHRISPQLSQHARSRPGDVGHERILTVSQSTTTTTSKSVALESTDGLRLGTDDSRNMKFIPSATRSDKEVPQEETDPLPASYPRSKRDIESTQRRTSQSKRTEPDVPVPKTVPDARKAQSSRESNDRGSPILNVSSAIRKRSRSRSRTHRGDSELNMKRLRSSLKARQQQSDVDTRESGSERKRDASLDPTTAPCTDTQPPPPGATADISPTAVSRVRKKSVSRASRNSRQPFAPYVPPAMRTRAGQACTNDNLRKGSRKK